MLKEKEASMCDKKLKLAINEAEQLFLRNNIPFYKQTNNSYTVQGIQFFPGTGKWSSKDLSGDSVFSLVQYLRKKNNEDLINNIPWEENLLAAPEGAKLTLILNSDGKKKIVYGRRVGQEFQSLGNPSLVFTLENLLGWSFI
jgi:hypothetical protein